MLERFSDCVCGPDGTVDADPVPDQSGRYFTEPHCNRSGWNGRSYVAPEDGSMAQNDEFFCDDTPYLDPRRCGLEASN
jgi:hypothetical protein